MIKRSIVFFARALAALGACYLLFALTLVPVMRGDGIRSTLYTTALIGGIIGAGMNRLVHMYISRDVTWKSRVFSTWLFSTLFFFSSRTEVGVLTGGSASESPSSYAMGLSLGVAALIQLSTLALAQRSTRRQQAEKKHCDAPRKQLPHERKVGWRTAGWRAETWSAANFIVLWLITIVVGGAVALVVALTRNDFDHWLGFIATGALAAQLHALVLSSCWLASRQPHRHWHPAKIAILWGLLGVGWFCTGGLGDDGRVFLLIFGGGAAVAITLSLTWTWFSSREQALRAD